VHVISRKPLAEFARKHAEAKAPLYAWFGAARKGTFRNLAELKQTFKTVDYVPVRKAGYYVFNIGGNNYRLVAVIHFNRQKLYVRSVLTHREYDQGGWKR
jgi:mRNA interferase HigB